MFGPSVNEKIISILLNINKSLNKEEKLEMLRACSMVITLLLTIIKALN